MNSKIRLLNGIAESILKSDIDIFDNCCIEKIIYSYNFLEEKEKEYIRKYIRIEISKIELDIYIDNYIR